MGLFGSREEALVKLPDSREEGRIGTGKDDLETVSEMSSDLGGGEEEIRASEIIVGAHPKAPWLPSYEGREILARARSGCDRYSVDVDRVNIFFPDLVTLELDPRDLEELLVGPEPLPSPLGDPMDQLPIVVLIDSSLSSILLTKSRVILEPILERLFELFDLLVNVSQPAFPELVNLSEFFSEIGGGCLA